MDITATCYLELVVDTNTGGTSTITGEYGVADDSEVESALDKIFGDGSEETPDQNPDNDTPVDGDVATDDEVEDLIEDIFGEQP